jgi:hypothetical protein
VSRSGEGQSFGFEGGFVKGSCSQGVVRPTGNNQNGVPDPLPRWGPGHFAEVGNEEVNEMTVFAGKSDMAITLLLYPNDGANYLRLMPDCDEEDTLDTYDQFQTRPP